MITDLGIPLVVWLLMLVVGLELRIEDFRRVVVFPKATVVATLGQLILLPTGAALIILLLDPLASTAAGMILVVASPGGAISNFYAYLARANAALSVTLTAVSTAIALVTLPLISSLGFGLFLGGSEGVEVPVQQIVLQMLIMLVLPVVTGMTVRHLRPVLVKSLHPKLRRLSVAAMVLLVGLILFEQRHNFDRGTGEVVLAAVLYSVVAIGAGLLVGLLAELPREDRYTVLIEFCARNLAITAVVGVMVFERIEFALFAAVFFLTQLPIAVLLISLSLRRRPTPN